MSFISDGRVLLKFLFEIPTFVPNFDHICIIEIHCPYCCGSTQLDFSMEE